MLLIILLGLIVKLTSVSGDCVVGTQNVNLNWNKFSGDRLWYYRLYTRTSINTYMRCVVLKYASPEGNISPIIAWFYDISTQSPSNGSGYATNWNSTSWEEIYPQDDFWSGHSYPIAVDYDRYVIYKFCYAESNERQKNYTTLLPYHGLDVYVAYRKPFPDEETVNLVKKKLEENNIEYSELSDWPMTKCN